jgi:uncharacterized surface protein with fasciclin (FAS1) repeats
MPPPARRVPISSRPQRAPAPSTPWPRPSRPPALTETLKGEGPFTVFAPTDEAFAKLPEGTLESLLQDREKLATILKYHVVPGKVSSTQAMEISEANTVAEKPLAISKAGGKLMVGNATVTKADIPASNGVIHIIDTVLLPE